MLSERQKIINLMKLEIKQIQERIWSRESSIRETERELRRLRTHLAAAKDDLQKAEKDQPQ